MSRKEMATLTEPCGWKQEDTRVMQVEVMARAKGYAMVRLKGCMPFVAQEKNLTPPVIRRLKRELRQ